MTVVSIRGPLKESTKARELETKEKRIERSLKLIRMMANVDPETGKEAGAELQIVAIILLGEFPEYYSSYAGLLEHWKSNPNFANTRLTKELEQLVLKTEPNGKRRSKT